MKVTARSLIQVNEHCPTAMIPRMTTVYVLRFTPVAIKGLRRRMYYRNYDFRPTVCDDYQSSNNERYWRVFRNENTIQPPVVPIACR